MNDNFSFHSLPLPTWARRRILVPALLAILVGLGAFSLAPSAHATARTHTASAHHAAGALTDSGTKEGCPLGYACIYPQNAGWNNGVPEARGMYYVYGTYVLQNEYKAHYVLNNQTGNAPIYLCYHADGTDCSGTICPPYWINWDLTPFNSIVLAPPKSGLC
jgi:hypothetical protein